MAVKYQIFVSSTFSDLKDERQDAIHSILNMKHIPAGMELFPAADVQQLEYIKKIIDECDYYILIIGGRYGSLDDTGISYTEREYDYAVSTGKFVLAFIHSDVGNLLAKNVELKEDTRLALEAFKDKVSTGRLVRFWSTRQELQLAVLQGLMLATSDYPQIGWIRGNAAASEAMIAESNSLLQENRALQAKLETYQPPKIENLASLDDKFLISYTGRSSWRGNTSYPKSSMSRSWLAIFIAVAARLEKSQTDQVIESGLKELAKQSSTDTDMFDLDHSTKTRIKIQLEALGLIKSKVSTTTQGGTAEFLSLTPSGRALLVESMVIRSAVRTPDIEAPSMKPAEAMD